MPREQLKNGKVTSLCKICANPERCSNDSPPCQITTDHNDPIREELPCQSKSEANSSITVSWLPESVIPASVKAVKFRRELLRGKLPLSKSAQNTLRHPSVPAFFAKMKSRKRSNGISAATKRSSHSSKTISMN